jgi:hypothetical protein
MKASQINSGIYMIASLVSRDSYIGMSTNLARRIAVHRTNIQNRKGNERILRAFVALDSVEFRILELVPMPQEPCRIEDENLRAAQYHIWADAERFLRDREQHWLKMIRPTANVIRDNVNEKFNIDDLPVGPPPTLQQEGALS